jgi:hypothetical protein
VGAQKIFAKMTSSIANDMITRDTPTTITNYIRMKANMQETSLNLITHKKFLLAFIFALPKSA